MIMFKYLCSFCLALLILSCSNNDDSTIETNINLVTGMDLRADEFTEPIRLGNPNIFAKSSVAYPNPTFNVLNIALNGNQNVQSVFIINGLKTKSFQDVDFSSILNLNSYSSEQISSESFEEFEINNTVDGVVVNLENYDEGYYRLFIETNNGFEWHNIYKGTPNIEELIDEWDD